jgi:N-acetylglucosamine malate deacetylase 1
MSRPVLVVAAHPDDEILGIGGTVRRHTLVGDDVLAMVLCEGESVRGQPVQEEVGHRAAAILGSKLEFCRYPDQRLEEVPLTKIIGEIEARIRAHRPEIVYTQFGGDVNVDHQRLFDAVLVAARPIRETVRAVYAFETCSSTEWGWPGQFRPDTFVDISGTLDAKIAAFACYDMEVCAWPHPRSLESLRHRAHYFGSMACMTAAEPLMTIRRWSRPGDPIFP